MWMIGNLVLVALVVPILVALLNRVLAALERIRGAADDTLAAGVALIGELDTAPELLAITDETIKEVADGAVRYAGSVGKLLGWIGGLLMATVAWFTVAIAGLIIAATALGLIRVILHLVAVKRTLGNLLGGVQVIAEKTSTVPVVLPSVNENLRPVREFCDTL